MLPFASILHRLFGLGADLPLGGPDLRLGWLHPLPSWGWGLVFIAALLVGAASYVRLAGGRGARALLAGLRAALVLLVALLLAGPRLVQTERTRVEDAVVVLVDRSLSMNFADLGDAADPETRDAAVRAALAANPGLFGPEKLGRNRHLSVLGFDGGAWPMDVNRLPDPAGRQSSLRTALEQGVAGVGGRRIAGVVLLTDGQSPQATDAAFRQALARQDVPVFAVPVGAPKPPPDLAIARLRTPPAAFVADRVPVTLSVAELGLPAGQFSVDPAKVRIELRDPATGAVLDSTTLDKAVNGEVRLSLKSGEAGTRAYKVEVVADGVRELSQADNGRSFEVAFLDRPLRVLYIDGYPRWGYRYLKNTLLREGARAEGSDKTLIESSIWLCEADRSFVQEGTRPIQRLPQTREEFAQYDVIVIGDIPPGYLTPASWKIIHDQVALRGGGLLFIGGGRWLPARYGGEAAATLLPMQNPQGVGRLEANFFDLKPTPRAGELSLLELRPPGHPDGTWPKDLPPLWWAQDLGELKPNAETMAESVGADGRRRPVLTRMIYGAGEVFYLGTDEIWRWRRLAGEAFHDPFWIQLLRKLGRTRVERSGRSALLHAEPEKLVLGQETRVRLELYDPALIEAVGAAASAKTRALQGADAPGALALQLEGDAAEVAAAGVAVLSASFKPDATGRHLVAVDDPNLPEEVRNALSATVDVVANDDELARTATDFPRLEELARDTGGRVVPLAELGRLPEYIQDRAQEKTREIPHDLWHAPLFLALLVLLPGLEWLVRRMNQLV